MAGVAAGAMGNMGALTGGGVGQALKLAQDRKNAPEQLAMEQGTGGIAGVGSAAVTQMPVAPESKPIANPLENSGTEIGTFDPSGVESQTVANRDAGIAANKNTMQTSPMNPALFSMSPDKMGSIFGPKPMDANSPKPNLENSIQTQYT